MRVGTHAAVASPDRGDSLADAFPRPMFGISDGTVGMVSRIKARFPRLPQIIGYIFHGGTWIRAASPHGGVESVFVGREFIDWTTRRLRLRFSLRLYFSLSYG
jgi:hypothetical protein